MRGTCLPKSISYLTPEWHSAVVAWPTKPKEDQRTCVMMRYFHFFLLWARISGTRGRVAGSKGIHTQKKETITKRSHAHRKNTNDFVFYCIQMKVRQKQGLQKEFADWPWMGLTAGLRSPPPGGCWLLLLAFGRLGLFLLQSEDRAETRR